MEVSGHKLHTPSQIGTTLVGTAITFRSVHRPGHWRLARLPGISICLSWLHLWLACRFHKHSKTNNQQGIHELILKIAYRKDQVPLLIITDNQYVEVQDGSVRVIDITRQQD